MFSLCKLASGLFSSSGSSSGAQASQPFFLGLRGIGGCGVGCVCVDDGWGINGARVDGGAASGNVGAPATGVISDSVEAVTTGTTKGGVGIGATGVIGGGGCDSDLISTAPV